MTLERYPRSARRFHTAVYTITLLLLASGWWLLGGREGQPTPIARLTGVPDVVLHVWLGWALLAIAILPLAFAMRGVIGFVRETLRYDRGDVGWLLRWPVGVLTGRFGRHEGHFDPGQRLANIAMVAAFVAVTGSGIGMALLHGGPAFVWLVPLHVWSTYVLIPLVLGHIAIASGILPGYHGVWRSMHLGGRLDVAVARRVWPGWLDRHEQNGR